MSKVVRTERGWPGHFIAAYACFFRRNTLLEMGNVKVVVSTVGNYHDHDGNLQEIGWNRHYETMAFYAEWEPPYWEADVARGFSFASEWAISGVERDSDALANAMHESVVDEISQIIEGGNDE